MSIKSYIEHITKERVKQVDEANNNKSISFSDFEKMNPAEGKTIWKGVEKSLSKLKIKSSTFINNSKNSTLPSTTQIKDFGELTPIFNKCELRVTTEVYLLNDENYVFVMQLDYNWVHIGKGRNGYTLGIKYYSDSNTWDVGRY